MLTAPVRSCLSPSCPGVRERFSCIRSLKSMCYHVVLALSFILIKASSLELSLSLLVVTRTNVYGRELIAILLG